MPKAKKLTEYELQEFYAEVRVKLLKNTSWRLGQAMYNTLHESHPDLAEELNASSFDPFHDNGKINDFINYITGF